MADKKDFNWEEFLRRERLILDKHRMEKDAAAVAEEFMKQVKINQPAYPVQ